jgi:hypothetical protein
MIRESRWDEDKPLSSSEWIKAESVKHGMKMYVEYADLERK